MKVAHIITSLSPHGAQMMLCKLLSRMDRSRFDSVVISLRDRGSLGEKIEELGIAVCAIGMKSALPAPLTAWRLIRSVSEFRPDIIQGWMYHGNLAAQMAGKRVGTRVLWNVRGSSYNLNDEKRLTAAMIWLGAKLSGLPERIINNSMVSAQKHEEVLGYRRDKRVIIPNGFDTSVLAPSHQARLAVRSELGLDEDTLLVGLMARYHPMKDHASFLRAAANVVKKHPQAHFVLAGEDVDRSNSELCRLINELGIAPNLHLLGERKDINRLNAALDIAALSSAFGEGFPNVVGEAMACGVPCVVTDVGDSGWIVGETGRVVSPRDWAALSNALSALLTLDREARQCLGQAARQRVIDNFSLDAITLQYEALYEQILSEQKSYSNLTSGSPQTQRAFD